MGYFAQRKRRRRENMFIASSLIILGIIAIIGSFDGIGNLSFFIKNYFFQFYLFNIFILAFSVYCRKILFTILSSVLLIFGYAHISSASNIFINTKVDNADKAFDLTYAEDFADKPGVLTKIPGMIAESYGQIRLSPDFSAYYTAYKSESGKLTLVRVDFSGIKISEQKQVFNNLAEFVSRRDEPLVIYGNFGTSGWSPYFKTFLQKTSLEIKNRVILNNLHGFFRLFNIPVINVVAYNNIGISAVKNVSENKEAPAAVIFSIQYLSSSDQN